MKKWFIDVLKRIGDLIIKSIAYKVMASSVVTWVYVQFVLPIAPAAPALAVVGFIVVAFMWAMTISYRFAEKLAINVKSTKD